MISYIIPTRNRAERLAATLDALERLGDHRECGGAEVVVADNASDQPADLPPTLRTGLELKHLRLVSNLGAAARNVAAEWSDPRADWLVMLDDDSSPIDNAFLAALPRQPADVAAVMADIFLPRARRREDGGLPEVFIGCGVALRRRDFLDAGGYDQSFHYYAEEYDLAARLLLAGKRIAFEPSFRVAHLKDASHRDFEAILARLVRNNGWVVQRYAPEPLRFSQLLHLLRRYRAVGRNEHAERGYLDGLRSLRHTIAAQSRTPMPVSLFDRFTGLAHARQALHWAFSRSPFRSAALIDEGKNAWVVRRALEECGARLVPLDREPQAVVVGSMSPGPMLDSYQRTIALTDGPMILAPWMTALRFERLLTEPETHRDPQSPARRAADAA